jgi:hypothetical protein
MCDQTHIKKGLIVYIMSEKLEKDNSPYSPRVDSVLTSIRDDPLSTEPLCEKTKGSDESSVEFVLQDTTEVNDDTEDIKKYTKIDNLDEDPPIPGQEWCCISFLSPEGVYNCRVRGVKFRGGFPTRKDAEAWADKLRSIDKYFHIFVGQTGKWLAWDPKLDEVPEHKHSDKRLDKLVKEQKKNNMRDLNVLAGKKKQMIDNSESVHNKRVEDGKKNAKNVKKSESVPNVAPQQKPKNNHSSSAALERLRRNLEKRKAAQESAAHSDMKLKEELIAKESERIKAVETNVQSDGTKLSDLNKNILKIKEYIQKHKESKGESKVE